MRYLPLTDGDRAAMLKTIGVDSVDDLFCDVPKGALLADPVELPSHASEMAVERMFEDFAAQTLSAGRAPAFLGAGTYRHHVPASVDYLIQRGEFLTAYTPYQPEISQGTLQVLFEFQTQVTMLTGMEVANASMYDGATACAEAVLMAQRVTRRNKALLSGSLHPHYREVVRTHARFSDFSVDLGHPDPTTVEDLAALIDDETACVVVQNPDFFGRLSDFSALAEAAHAHGALLIVVVTEIVSLGAVTPPGAMGADIVVGEGQSLGNAPSFGGPHVGLFAVRQKLLRQMPGRLAGETVDMDGKRGWVLTLSTREQHIRREKATSNICTNAGLCALAFSIHLSLLGEDGFARLAALNHANAVSLAERLDGLDGVELLNRSFFNEFTVRLSKPADQVVNALADRGILGGVPVSRLLPEQPELARLMLVATSETVTPSDMDSLCAGLKEVLK